MASNSGGAAFPQVVMQGPGVAIIEESGMYLRDYFAAHAPRKPWPWFEPAMPPKPAEQWSTYHRNGECGGFCECMPENYRERDDWNKERERQKVMQWPYGYADAMIKAREATHGA